MLHAPFARLVLCASAILLACSAARAAADVAGSKDHPVLGRFAGAAISDYRQKSFDAASLPVARVDDAGKPGKLLALEGKTTHLNYRIAGAKTAMEAAKNYEQALTKGGFKLLFTCANADCGGDFSQFVHLSGQVAPKGFGDSYFGLPQRGLLAQRSSPQGDVYVFLHMMESGRDNLSIYQQVVEVQPMQTDQIQVLDAAALQKGLQAEGRIAVYGVFFDTGKADVKPESKPSLDEMGKLLKNAPALKVYIVGHTDNQGQLAQNLDLSQRRAEAVAKALAAQYGVAANRLAAKGVASLAPVASNEGDAGRAKNRRVELVVQ
ncbi:OmpA family protein [Variovorax terrae]|uniref:DUF4892 domain-containing protein n=1 Tax=Variovorax terrae TaxID=2923278 RepID=A0A9X1VRH1_9BURK|nr:OmpA family protein [Variovorax terrae]MCJ0762055.1 DUF4892 domain-containing protein [Variovorax terrae]